MKPTMTVVYGQAPELSTSFQTGELTRHLADDFEIRHYALRPKNDGIGYQLHRLARNFVAPALRRLESDFVLYGNDGFASLKHWRGRRVLYWYDAPADWSITPPTSFKDRLRRDNVLIADDVFAVSAAQVRVAQALRRGRENSVHYLPVGVDCSFFDPARADREGSRRKFGFSPTDIVVGYLGYLGRWQNRFAGEALLEAFAILKNPNIRVLVIGSGPASDDWRRVARERQCANKIVFAGFVPQKELPSALAATDICVDTLEPGFHSEARSETKLKQYMAMGRACVATDIGENCVDLDGGSVGELVAPDPQSLAAALDRLSIDADRRESLGRAARARAAAIYDWPHLARRMAEVLKNPTL